MQDLFDHQLVSIDIEGDGNSPIEPVEITALDFDRDAIIGERTWLCNPGRPMNPYAIAIHGLTDDDVAGAPGFETFAPEIHRSLHGKVVVGHGVHGDMHILVRKIPQLNGTRCIDTLKLAKAVAPGLPSYRLFDLVDHLGLKVPTPIGARGKHSSSVDALAARQLLLRLIEDRDPAAIYYLRSAGFTLNDHTPNRISP